MFEALKKRKESISGPRQSQGLFYKQIHTFLKCVDQTIAMGLPGPLLIWQTNLFI